MYIVALLITDCNLNTGTTITPIEFHNVACSESGQLGINNLN